MKHVRELKAMGQNEAGMQEELWLLKRTSRCSRIQVAFEQRPKDVKGQVLWNLGRTCVAGTDAHCPQSLPAGHRDS